MALLPILQGLGILAQLGGQTASYLSRKPEDYRPGVSGLPSQFSQGGQQQQAFDPLVQMLMQRQQQAQMQRQNPGYQMMRYL